MNFYFKISKKQFFILIVYVSTIIVTIIGATFAYFGAVTNSDENIIDLEAAVFEMGLEEDISLINFYFTLRMSLWPVSFA